MMVASEIRRENARALLRSECDGVPAEFGRRIERADTQVNHLIGPNPVKNIGTKLARVIEKAFGRPVGWLDVRHDENPHLADDKTMNALHALHRDQGTAGIDVDVMAKTIEYVEPMLARIHPPLSAHKKAWAYKIAYETVAREHADIGKDICRKISDMLRATTPTSEKTENDPSKK
jgi:hypothetical protein